MKCAESAFGVVCGRRMNGVAPFMPVVAVALLGAFPAAQMLVVPLCLLLPLPFPHFWRGIPGNWTFFTRRLDWKMIGIGIPLGFAGVMLFQFFLAAVAWGFGLEMTEQPLVEYIRAMSGRRLIFFGFLLAVWSPLLEELGYEYELDEDGDYKMVMALDGGRTQMVFIRSGVETYGRHRVREIWSPAYRVDAGAFPGPVANRLLEASHALKLGAWVNNAGFAVLVVKVDAGIDAEALDQAIGAAVTSADEMERELSGDPDSDEF